MWTRKEVKERAKESLKRNYWKVVLVSFLLIVIGGGMNSPAAANGASAGRTSADKVDFVILKNPADIEMPAPEQRAAMIEEITDTVGEAIEEAAVELKQINPAVWIAMVIVYAVVVLIVFVIAIAVDAFLINPLCIGAQRFMLKSVDDTGEISELGYTFDHNYKNGVRTAFFRDLHIILWCCLFLIPGIYKKYQYYMVDYILAENPDMPTKEVLELSKKMMDGHKWNTFVLDLSFILWHMLATLTCGILEIFYVRPYLYLTRASLYRTMCGRNDGGAKQEMIVDMEQKLQ